MNLNWHRISSGKIKESLTRFCFRLRKQIESQKLLKRANQIDFNCITTNDAEELLGEMNDKFPKSTEAKEQNLNEAKFDTKGVDKDIKETIDAAVTEFYKFNAKI